MRIFHLILSWPLPRATITFILFHAGLSSRTDMACLPLLLSPLACRGQASQHNRAHILSLRFLAAGKTSQHERPHSLFFTDSLSHISNSLLSTTRRPHPIYGPLVSGKSFFHHSSFLLNQRVLGETNWIFSPPVLTSAF